MGLRINHNIPGIRALRNLGINDRNQLRSLERLSTGLRINRAADDPSGLIISEQLRAQIRSLGQAVENTENAGNLINTADTALQKMSDLLIGIRDSVNFALNTGGNSPEQIAAEQASVDNAVEAIDRIAATTRFSGRSLLNGTSGFQVLSTVGSGINDLRIRALSFGQGVSSRTVTVTMTTSAQRAAILFSTVVSSAATIRISGPFGTQEITISSGLTAAGIASAINGVAGFTGAFASADPVFAGGSFGLMSQEFGSTQTIRIELISGTMNLGAEVDPDAAPAAVAVQSEGFISSDIGTDAEATIAGIDYTAVGRRFSAVTTSLNLEFTLNVPDTSTFFIDPATVGVTQEFRVSNSGLKFQLNETDRLSDRMQVGIDGVGAAFLGFEEIQDILARATAGDVTIDQGGFLPSIRTGNENDLTNNPGNAQRIIDAAINQVNGLRGFLGAVQAFNLEPNEDALNVHIENLQSTESQIRDLDFAEETANFTRTQILFQAGTAVLASANLIPQTVLTLLR